LNEFQKNIRESEIAIHSLFTCRGKYSKPKNRSTLQLVIDHWVFDHNGKAEVESGIFEVEHLVKQTENLLEEARMYVCTPFVTTIRHSSTLVI